MNTAKCKSCGQPIWWATTAEGKNLPLDPAPLAFGGNVIVCGGTELKPLVRVLHKGEKTLAGTSKFRAHFATCPTAKQHRKQKKADARAADKAELDKAKRATVEPPTLF